MLLYSIHRLGTPPDKGDKEMITPTLKRKNTMKTSTFFMTIKEANDFADLHNAAYFVSVGSVAKAYREKGNFVVTVCDETGDEIENIKEVKEIELTK